VPYNAKTGELGDVIIGVNARPTQTLTTLVSELDRVGVDNTAELTVLHNGKRDEERKVRVKVIDVRS
jgi:2-alkenal reductase